MKYCPCLKKVVTNFFLGLTDNHYKLEKGTLPERVGRKATGLSPGVWGIW